MFIKSYKRNENIPENKGNNETKISSCIREIKRVSGSSSTAGDVRLRGDFGVWPWCVRVEGGSIGGDLHGTWTM